MLKRILEMNEVERVNMARQQLNRWDKYRQDREALIDKAVRFVKIHRRNKVLIAIIVLHRILNIFKFMVAFRQKLFKRKFDELMIAIRVKIRFMK